MERAKQKEKALELLKQLNIHKPYIDGFRENDQVCMFEHYIGFWADQYPELEKKIREIEARYGVLVYAITHEYTEFGELYDFLVLSQYKSEWKYTLTKYGDEYIVFSYVWNKTDDCLSEFGSIGIKSRFGGLMRTA